MRKFLYKLRLVGLATLIVGAFVAMSFWLDHKVASLARITICWATLLLFYLLADLIFKKNYAKFSTIRLLASLATTFWGLGSVHFLRGDDIGTTLFALFSIGLLVVAFLIGKFSHSEDTKMDSMFHV